MLWQQFIIIYPVFEPKHHADEIHLNVMKILEKKKQNSQLLREYQLHFFKLLPQHSNNYFMVSLT